MVLFAKLPGAFPAKLRGTGENVSKKRQQAVKKIWLFEDTTFLGLLEALGTFDWYDTEEMNKESWDAPRDYRWIL